MANLIDTDASIFPASLFGTGKRRIITVNNGIYICFLNTSNNVEIHKSLDAGTTWVNIYTSLHIAIKPDISIVSDNTNVYVTYISTGMTLNCITLTPTISQEYVVTSGIEDNTPYDGSASTYLSSTILYDTINEKLIIVILEKYLTNDSGMVHRGYCRTLSSETHGSTWVNIGQVTLPYSASEGWVLPFTQVSIYNSQIVYSSYVFTANHYSTDVHRIYTAIINPYTLSIISNTKIFGVVIEGGLVNYGGNSIIVNNTIYTINLLDSTLRVFSNSTLLASTSISSCSIGGVHIAVSPNFTIYILLEKTSGDITLLSLTAGAFSSEEVYATGSKLSCEPTANNGLVNLIYQTT